ncbi:MAG: cytochrome b/b6 domain-containing protein [Sedimenticola sp.]|uniref:Cytochrome B n=1 Tax=Sedimenticola thiotaurini TaxID=1543721 RepID=A0A558CSJ1_9GAMM|nr:cytochrome b/b6 domain-containing protein [Sedimenticola sp.]MCW8921078.1 cytochrome b/b6 domain-containing protein [Sedimenticola sp.]MCW8949972.1 cytochrome b/b6 domain-containing protein [Sedimenticola sp.]TVT51734.1 MAG: cytochrome B [Sedimenticola thiotaurini]
MHTSTLHNEIKVWDLPVRVFHWSLASCFFIAYITEDDFIALHSYAGYTIIGLILFRLIWGFVGTKHARFSDFAAPPTTVLDYIKQVIAFRAKRYVGHNPAGGAMVFALLLALSLTSLTGLATYGVEQSAGPLAGFMSTLPIHIGKAAEELHEFFANFTLLLILFHLAGVFAASFQHGENLIRAMFTGRKQQAD